MSNISAIGIKRLFYGEPIKSVAIPYDEGNTDNETGLSPEELKTFLSSAKEVKNMHQDTWNFERSEASVTSYKNQLTKKVYRQDAEPGESTISFSIGQYDFQTKADFEGGVGSAKKYSSPSSYNEITKTIVALTEDDVYIVFPKATINARGAAVDNAIAISVSATPMEPDIDIEMETWILKSAVDKAV